MDHKNNFSVIKGNKSFFFNKDEFLCQLILLNFY